MSRGHIAGLETPRPFGEALPALYQESQSDEIRRHPEQREPFALNLTRAFDEVMAPVFASLDNVDAYIDPALAPEDFLDWLAGWVGVLLDETWPIERRRAFVALAAELYRQRGTAAGLANHVRVFTAGDVEIEESGGSAWSTTPDAAMPGRPDFSLLVRIRAEGTSTIDRARLDALVAGAKPAHVVHRVEVAGPKPSS